MGSRAGIVGFDTDMGGLEREETGGQGSDKVAVTIGMVTECQKLLSDPLRELKVWDPVRLSPPPAPPHPGVLIAAHACLCMCTWSSLRASARLYPFSLSFFFCFCFCFFFFFFSLPPPFFLGWGT
jgi:hypothetical protein